MKQNLNLFLMKTCNLSLIKLKTNIDLVSLKFLAILTKDANNKLKIKLYNQYNEIENYIKNNSKNLEVVVEQYLNLLYYSSNIMELSYSMVYSRVSTYYQIFSELIQGKLKYISDKEMKSYRYRNLFVPSYSFIYLQNTMGYVAPYFGYITNTFNEDFNQFKNNWNNFKNNIKEKINEKFEFEKTIKTEITFDWIEKTISISKPYCLSVKAKLKSWFDKKSNLIKFNTPIVPGINFEIQLKPFIEAKICVGVGANIKFKNLNDSFFYINAFGEAEMGLELDAGLYIPTSTINTYVGISLGLKGLLGSGKIGIQFQLFFQGEKSNLFAIDSFYELQALSLEFYIKAQYHFTFFAIKNSFEVYLYKVQLFAYKKEFHKIRYISIKDSKEELCQEITIEGWTSSFMTEEDKDKIKKISLC